MDTEKTDQTKGGEGQKRRLRSPSRDLSGCRSCGSTRGERGQAVARKAVKAVAKRAPAKNVATRVAEAARPPKKTAKKAVKKVTKKAKKTAKKAMPRRATKRS